jgi:hypothetical protein
MNGHSFFVHRGAIGERRGGVGIESTTPKLRFGEEVERRYQTWVLPIKRRAPNQAHHATFSPAFVISTSVTRRNPEKVL